MIYWFLYSLIAVFIFMVCDMYMSYDFFLPSKFVEKYRISKKSILRKIVPIFESEKKHIVCLKYRVIPILISEIVLIIGIFVVILDCKYDFVPNFVYKMFAIFYSFLCISYCVICSLIKYIFYGV